MWHSKSLSALREITHSSVSDRERVGERERERHTHTHTHTRGVSRTVELATRRYAASRETCSRSSAQKTNETNPRVGYRLPSLLDAKLNPVWVPCSSSCRRHPAPEPGQCRVRTLPGHFKKLEAHVHRRCGFLRLGLRASGFRVSGFGFSYTWVRVARGMPVYSPARRPPH
jgi:hypothetical protein